MDKIMIISKKHKFIFIHIPKNAGTSISECLRNFTQEDKHWAVSSSTKHQTLNDLIAMKTEASLSKKIFRDFSFLEYYKFAIVRNPFDRMISLYDYLNKYKVRNEILKVSSFEEFVEELNNPSSWVNTLHSSTQQLNYIIDQNGSIGVDNVVRFENLDKSIDLIEKELGFNLELKRLNESKSRKSYKTFYNNNTKKIIEDKFRDDLEIFNYGF